MKKLIITLATGLFSLSAAAQPFEIGINGGLSTTSKPYGSLYQGTDNIINYTGDINFHYNFSERWQTGLSIGITQWQRKDSWPLTSAYKDSLGSMDVKMILADPAVSFAFQLNHIVPFYERYEDFVQAHLYFGVAAGAVITGNSPKMEFSRVMNNSRDEYTYTSEFHYGSGYGFLLGAQIGYSYFFNEHLGINLELAPKMAFMKTNDARFHGANNRFNVLYWPATIGIHYRFGYSTY